jgi:hypothetical protein
MAFLSDMYRKRCWYVEPLMLLSRISIGSLPILLESSVAQLALGLVLSAVWALYFASLNPFTSLAQNVGNNCCNLATAVVMIGAQLVKVKRETEAKLGVDSMAISFLLCACTAMPFVAIFALCLMEIEIPGLTSTRLFADVDAEEAANEETLQYLEQKVQDITDKKDALQEALEEKKRGLEETNGRLEGTIRRLLEQSADQVADDANSTSTRRISLSATQACSPTSAPESGSALGQQDTIEAVETLDHPFEKPARASPSDDEELSPVMTCEPAVTSEVSSRTLALGFEPTEPAAHTSDGAYGSKPLESVGSKAQDTESDDDQPA